MRSRQLQYLSLHDNNLRALPASVVQLLLDEKTFCPRDFRLRTCEVILSMPESEARAFAEARAPVAVPIQQPAAGFAQGDWEAGAALKDGEDLAMLPLFKELPDQVPSPNSLMEHVS